MGLFGPPDIQKLKEERNINKLINALLYKKLDVVIKDAAEALGEIGDPRAVEPLIATMKDINIDWRHKAVEALGKIGDIRAVEPLIAAMNDKNEQVRRAAATALEHIGLEHVDNKVKTWVYIMNSNHHGLVAIGEPAVEPLIDALKNSSFSIRQAATLALGEIRDTRAIKPLIAALGDEILEVSVSARIALEEIGKPAVEFLIDALKDVEERIRVNTKEALETITGLDFKNDYDAWYQWWQENK